MLDILKLLGDGYNRGYDIAESRRAEDPDSVRELVAENFAQRQIETPILKSLPEAIKGAFKEMAKQGDDALLDDAAPGW